MNRRDRQQFLRFWLFIGIIAGWLLLSVIIANVIRRSGDAGGPMPARQVMPSAAVDVTAASITGAAPVHSMTMSGLRFPKSPV